jgi:hypothetical protein
VLCTSRHLPHWQIFCRINDLAYFAGVKKGFSIMPLRQCAQCYITFLQPLLMNVANK